MGARGPKSAAELTSIQGFKAKAPPPDAKLTDAQAAVWKRITASKPGDWFNGDDLFLLAELCRALDMCDRLADAIDAMDIRNGDTLARRLALRDKEARRVTVLATKLRLTPQSRYDKGAAATAAKRPNGARPWEFSANPFAEFAPAVDESA
jgi:hypothetical protein